MVNKTSRPYGSPDIVHRFSFRPRSKSMLLLLGAGLLCAVLVATNTFPPASATGLSKLRVDSTVLNGESELSARSVSPSFCQVTYAHHLRCWVTLSVPPVSQEQVRWNAQIKNRAVARLITISPGYGTLVPGQQVKVMITIRGSGGLFPIFFVGSHNTIKVMCLCTRK